MRIQLRVPAGTAATAGGAGHFRPSRRLQHLLDPVPYARDASPLGGLLGAGERVPELRSGHHFGRLRVHAEAEAQTAASSTFHCDRPRAWAQVRESQRKEGDDCATSWAMIGGHAANCHTKRQDCASEATKKALLKEANDAARARCVAFCSEQGCTNSFEEDTIWLATTSCRESSVCPGACPHHSAVSTNDKQFENCRCGAAVG